MEERKRLGNVIPQIRKPSRKNAENKQQLQTEVRKLKWYCRDTEGCLERGRCVCKTASSRLFQALIHERGGAKRAVISLGKSLFAKAVQPNIGIRNTTQEGKIVKLPVPPRKAA